MGANHFFQKSEFKKKQQGQSVIEFAFLMPILVGVLSLLIQVEMAISTAIVNQKYSRSQLMYLMFNNRYLLEERFLKLDSGLYKRQYYVGVSDKVEAATAVKVSPAAPVRKIGSFRPGGDESSQVEGIPRQNVRVRTLVFTCLPPVGFNYGEQFSENKLTEGTFKVGGYTYCDGDK